MTRIAFLYNHEAAHQVRHSAAVIAPFLARYPMVQVTVFASSDMLMEAVRAVCGPEVTARCTFFRLEIPAWHRPFVRFADLAFPLSRLDQLSSNRKAFVPFDALIVTEGTSLYLKKFDELKNLKIIRIDHGAGDRSIGFTRTFSGNDLVLLPGVKQRDRFLQLGYLRADQMAVVGYGKFDTVDIAKGRVRKFFANDRPTVVYNPHPEPLLSSWYDMGLDVLEYFYNSPDYNLIFAPHVMLFRRRFHMSVERFRVRYRGDLPDKYRRCSHMLIDTGSAASSDMTYTLASDIYLGDASSQVYEFLIEPRPCIILNSHNARWQGDPNYAFWNFGPVVHTVGEMATRLQSAAADHRLYRPLQEKGFRDTFDLQATPSSQRAADAIAAFLGLVV